MRTIIRVIALTALGCLAAVLLLFYRNQTLSVTIAGVSNRAVIPSTYFGMHVLDFTHVAPALLFGTSRSWDAGPGLDWAEANPAQGTYNFTALDHFIAYNKAREMEGIYTFGRTPRWASSQPNNPASPYGPGQCAPPSNISYWDDYVTAVATHAAGRIKYWEIWNEPNDTSYCGDVASMVIMAQHARQIIKKIDPAALILTPATAKDSGPPWLAKFLAGGGSQAIDIITFHGYWSAKPEDILTAVTAYRAVITAQGLSSLPLWDTESSWAYTSEMTLPPVSQQMAYISRSYLLHWSLGVTRYIWYAYDASSPWGTLYTSQAGESRAVGAYREVYRWMVGASLTSPCAERNRIWTCSLERPNGYSAEAVWTTESTANYQVPRDFTQYLDLSGAEHGIVHGTVKLSGQPILLQTGPLPR